MEKNELNIAPWCQATVNVRQHFINDEMLPVLELFDYDEIEVAGQSDFFRVEMDFFNHVMT